MPETSHVKLNGKRIETSLVYLDTRTELGKYIVPSTQQSLRHLAISKAGRIAAALQFDGHKTLRDLPLMMFHMGEMALRLVEPTASHIYRHVGYQSDEN